MTEPKVMSMDEFVERCGVRPSLSRRFLLTSLWFAMPFLVCWGLGTDPVVAARVAVGVAVIAWIGSAVSAWIMVTAFRGLYALLTALEQP